MTFGGRLSVQTASLWPHGDCAHSAILRASVLRERVVASRKDILRQGEAPLAGHVLLKGCACRYRMLRNGRRQITAVLIPGDLCELEAVLTGRSSYSVGTLTKCWLGEIALAGLAKIDDLEPALRLVIWRQLLRDEAISREWILSLGRRHALERLAHLFCELWTRLKGVRLATKDSCQVPLTQVDLGDILGLSSVHVNRTMQALRATGLVVYQDNTLRIIDYIGLRDLAGFNSSYLE